MNSSIRAGAAKMLAQCKGKPDGQQQSMTSTAAHRVAAGCWSAIGLEIVLGSVADGKKVNGEMVGSNRSITSIMPGQT